MKSVVLRTILAVGLVALTLAAVFGLRGELFRPKQGGDFTLQSADGPVSLEQFRGKYVLIYFGYTFCPDACPTSLAMMSQAFRTLSPEALDQVQGIFISVDPERDTVARLKEYAAYFHPKIIGVTGSPMDLALIASQYQAIYRSQKVGGASDYLVDHTSTIYLVDPSGEVVHEFQHGTPSDLIVAELRRWLPQTRTGIQDR